MSNPFSSIAGFLQAPLTFPPVALPNGRNVRHSDKYCGVCGDISNGYHFGGLCCNSCKSFFRRSIKNHNYQHFYCNNHGDCILMLSKRKNCRFCRIKRCFEIGMDKCWLWTDEARSSSIQKGAEKQLKKHVGKSVTTNPVGCILANYCSSLTTSLFSTRRSYQPKIEHITHFLTILEVKEIESIITKYSQANQNVPYRNELSSPWNPVTHKRSRNQVVEVIGTAVQCFHYFTQLMADFMSLPTQDQDILLRDGVLEMCILRLALVNDPINNSWPSQSLPIYKDTPVLYPSDINHFIAPHLHQMNYDFINWIKQMDIDEPTVMLLLMIVLFTPERDGIIWKDSVEKCQLHYTTVMERYMKWRYGPKEYKSLFSKLLTKLCDLRELGEAPNFCHGDQKILQHSKTHRVSNLAPCPSFLNVRNEHSLDGTNGYNRSLLPIVATCKALHIPQPSALKCAPAVTEEIEGMSQMIQVDEYLNYSTSADTMGKNSLLTLSFGCIDPHSSTNHQVNADEFSLVAPSPRTLKLLFEELEEYNLEI